MTRIPHELEGLLLYLLKQGSKADAVRLYQDETGARRMEAKRIVKELAQRHRIGPNDTGFADLVFLALMLVSLLLGIIFC